MRLLRMAAAMLAVAFLAACLPVTTKVAAGSTKNAGLDPALIGTWRVLPGKQAVDRPAYLHILADGKGAMTALLVMPGTVKKTGDYSIYAVSAARLGPNHILNARTVYSTGGPANAEEAAANIPLLYRLDGSRRLSLYLIDEAAARAAVRSGAVAGTVHPGDNGDVAFTADAAALDAFLASPAGTALFKQPFLRLAKVD